MKDKKTANEPTSHMVITSGRLRLLLFVIIISSIIPFLMNFIPSAPHFIYVIVSDSMAPTINKGDVVITLPREMLQQQLNTGQIALFSSPLDNNQIFVHRIAKIEIIDGKRFFITKGDNNPSSDSFPIPESKVIGTVQYIIPYVGIILLLPREVLLSTTICLIIAYLVITFQDNRKKENSDYNARLREGKKNQRHSSNSDNKNTDDFVKRQSQQLQNAESSNGPQSLGNNEY